MINRLNKNILSLAAIALFAISCTQSKEIKPTIIEGEAAVSTADSQTGGATIVSSNPEAVVNGKQVSAPNIATTVNPQVQKVAPGMNPAHGEPGHRCDISVGAPLNSSPGNAAAAAAAPQQTVMPAAAPTPAPVANPMNLAVNPAHGEPGHSCAIAVGAPFK